MRRPGETHRDACERKYAYGRQQGAAEALDRMTEQGHETDGLRPYRCPFCRRWHLGHGLSVEGMAELAREIRGL